MANENEEAAKKKAAAEAEAAAKLTSEEAAKRPKLVKMHRENLPNETGPETADVHPDEVDNMRKGGWRITEPK